MRKKLVGALSVIFLLMAFYKAWEDQRAITRASGQENTQLKKEIDGLTKPNFALDFMSVLTGPNTSPDRGSSHVIAVVKLTNRGAPAAASGESWLIDVTAPDGTTHRGTPQMIHPKGTFFCWVGPTEKEAGKMRLFLPEDSLDSKAAEVIQRNAYRQGVLIFNFADVSNKELNSGTTLLTVHVEDVLGNQFSKTESMDSLKQKIRAGFIEGIKYPYLLPSKACAYPGPEVAH